MSGSRDRGKMASPNAPGEEAGRQDEHEPDRNREVPPGIGPPPRSSRPAPSPPPVTPPILSVLLITLAGVILFITEALRVDAVAFLLLLALALSGLVGPEEALSGFAHPATATVAAMFVLSAGLRRTGVVAVADGALPAG